MKLFSKKQEKDEDPCVYYEGLFKKRVKKYQNSFHDILQDLSVKEDILLEKHAELCPHCEQLLYDSWVEINQISDNKIEEIEATMDYISEMYEYCGESGDIPVHLLNDKIFEIKYLKGIKKLNYERLKGTSLEDIKKLIFGSKTK